MTAMTVAQKLKLASRVPTPPVLRLSATRPPSMRNPMAPLAASRTHAPIARALRVPGVPRASQSLTRWESAGVGLNNLPAYMFRPDRPNRLVGPNAPPPRI